MYFFFFFFFFNVTATTEIYTLSLHDALPICGPCARRVFESARAPLVVEGDDCALRLKPVINLRRGEDRKSTRLNSSHVKISYAVFCLKKKKKKKKKTITLITKKTQLLDRTKK